MSNRATIAITVQQILHIVRTERQRMFGHEASDDLDAELARHLLKSLKCKHPDPYATTGVGRKVPTNEFAMIGQNVASKH